MYYRADWTRLSSWVLTAHERGVNSRSLGQLNGVFNRHTRRLHTMANAPENGKGSELPHGAYTRIARRLRPCVSPQHVRLVAIGKRDSVRVKRAIERYRE